jgi:phosphosulfolactate synthase
MAVKHFLEELGLPDRSHKPRDRGVTMVLPVAPHPIAPNILEAYSEYIDIVKILDREMWAPKRIVAKIVSAYRRHNIDVQLGGIPFEIARLQGREKALLAETRRLGFNVLEYETHVAKSTLEQTRTEVEKLKKSGFRIVGEVGSKWFWKDETRPSLAKIDVPKTIDRFGAFVDGGCHLVYWEGRVVANLIGRDLDNAEGQKQLMDVASAVGKNKILFEVWGPEMTLRGPAKYWSWLVSKFGPDVNIGNVVPEAVAFLESVRRGVTYEMDHPYLRWLQAGKPRKQWWSMDQPPYDAYV